MRATEFLPTEQQQPVTINIPITITIPSGGGMPQIGSIAAPAGAEMPAEPVMVPPLQQQLELAKQQGGKTSRVINQIVNDNGAASEEEKSPASWANSWNLQEDFEKLEEIFESQQKSML